MPIRDQLAACDIVWSTESGQEIAVNTLWFKQHHSSGAAWDWDEALQRLADGVADRLKTSAGSSSGAHVTTFMANTVRLDRVQCYAQWQAEGKATKAATHIATPTECVGAGSGQMLPPIVSPVIQLLAYNGFVANKRRRTGRLFAPPAPDSILDNTGLIPGGKRDDIGDAWTAFFNGVQGLHASGAAITPDYWDVGVYSRVDGAFNNLERVGVAAKLGVQRRRQNALATTARSYGTVEHG